MCENASFFLYVEKKKSKKGIKKGDKVVRFLWMV